MTNQKTSDIIKSSKEREVTNMRRVNYRVRKADGTEFHTTSYREATNGGNCIEETYLTEIDEKTKEQKERARARARKVQEILKAKRGSTPFCFFILRRFLAVAPASAWRRVFHYTAPRIICQAKSGWRIAQSFSHNFVQHYYLYFLRNLL